VTPVGVQKGAELVAAARNIQDVRLRPDSTINELFGKGKIGSTRCELDSWIKTLPQSRMIAREATIFTGWIYDHLLPYAEKVKVANPLMLRAITAAKRKNYRIDASKIADCLRCDFLPECYMASTEIRNRRRYRNLVLKQMTQMKNRISGLLMELA
jgi:hypothetical protein